MEDEYISLKEAAKQLGVRRETMYHYIRTLQFEKRKFPLDKQMYLRRSDFEKLRAIKEQAARRNAPSEEPSVA